MPSGLCWRAGCVVARRRRLWPCGRGSCWSAPDGHSIMEVSRRLRVARGHGPHLAAAVPRPRPGRPVRRAAAGWPADDHRRGRRAGHRQDAGGDAEERDPLVDAVDGGGNWACRSRRSRGSGGRSGCSRTARRRSSCRPTRYFIDKVRDVVGLYLDPPEKALVLCVDEKSQIQALDRSQPVLPMMPGVPERPHATTTSAPAPPPCSPPWRSPPAR